MNDGRQVCREVPTLGPWEIVGWVIAAAPTALLPNRSRRADSPRGERPALCPSRRACIRNACIRFRNTPTLYLNPLLWAGKQLRRAAGNPIGQESYPFVDGGVGR